MATARLFQHGGSQAVRLPKAFRFESTEVEIEKRGGEVVLRAKSKPRLETLACVALFMQENFPEARDFPDREQPQSLPGVAPSPNGVAREPRAADCARRRIGRDPAGKDPETHDGDAELEEADPEMRGGDMEPGACDLEQPAADLEARPSDIEPPTADPEARGVGMEQRGSGMEQRGSGRRQRARDSCP